MKYFVKFLLIGFSAVTLFACTPDNGDNEMEDEETSEGITQGMEHFWMEQREEFIELAEYQLDEWEEQIEEIEESEVASNLNERIEEIREKLSDLEQSEEEDWEEMRQDIAGDINDLREDIESEI